MSLEPFELHRRRLRALAYRMLGSRSEADDMVQEAWLRWQAADPATVQDPLAYLCRTTTHLCLDHLQSARVRREQYVGLWLPEPLVNEALADFQPTDPEAALGLRQQLSMGFLLALQHLSPLERAAFLLHDVFDLGFDELALTLERSAAACRQLASRARRRLRAQGFDADRPCAPDERFLGEIHPQRLALLDALAQALSSGNLDALTRLLAEDARLHSDGGGLVSAVPVPLNGRLRVAKALLAFARAWQRDPGAQTLQAAEVNGQPGALVWNAQGALEQVCALDLDARGLVRGLYFQRNPLKLQRIDRALAPVQHG